MTNQKNLLKDHPLAKEFLEVLKIIEDCGGKLHNLTETEIYFIFKKDSEVDNDEAKIKLRNMFKNKYNLTLKVKVE